MKLKFFPIVLGIVFYLLSHYAFSQDFSIKKKHRDWNVYSSSSSQCFLASKAKRTTSYFNSREILGKNRQNSFIYLFINKNNNNYSMSYFSDYPLKNNAAGTVNIDNKKIFKLTTINSNQPSGSKHAILHGLSKGDINLLFTGRRLTVELLGIDNSKLVDQFSLMGFTKSFNYIFSSCN